MFINVHQQTIKTPSPKQKKHQRHNTKPSPTHHHKHHRTITTQDREKTEIRPRHDRDITKTTPRHHRDKTKTRPRQDQDATETRPRHDRDILGEIFSGACTAPGRLIHVRPQAYRYWGTTLFQGPVLFEVILCRNYCCFFGRAALLLEQPLCSHQVPFWEAEFCFSLKQDVVVG